MQLLDATGREVWATTVVATQQGVVLPFSPTVATGGVYWLRVQTAQGAHYALRVVLLRP